MARVAGGPPVSVKGTAIYVLRAPGDDAVRWVGRTARPRARWICHAAEARSWVNMMIRWPKMRLRLAPPTKDRWVMSLLVRGQRPAMEIVEVVPRDGHALYRERDWIARLLAEGHPLLNRNDRPGGGAR